jgi:predicted aldo/keto reductase-like oxidoreductase
MMFGAIGNPDHDDAIRIIHKALDAGINFIDTADVYSHGESEEIVGKALKGRREAVRADRPRTQRQGPYDRFVLLPRLRHRRSAA